MYNMQPNYSPVLQLHYSCNVLIKLVAYHDKDCCPCKCYTAGVALRASLMTVSVVAATGNVLEICYLRP